MRETVGAWASLQPTDAVIGARIVASCGDMIGDVGIGT